MKRSTWYITTDLIYIKRISSGYLNNSFHMSSTTYIKWTNSLNNKNFQLSLKKNNLNRSIDLCRFMSMYRIHLHLLNSLPFAPETLSLSSMAVHYKNVLER